MPTLAELSALIGVKATKLVKLREYGLEFDEDDFEIDAYHQKALYELHRKRISAYVLAYAFRHSAANDWLWPGRFNNLEDIADSHGLSLSDALSEVRWKQIKAERLPEAKYWIDRAIAAGGDRTAFERIALWCKEVLSKGPPVAVRHEYLASRMLFSLLRDDMIIYPKLIHRALNKVKHHGFLDGWHEVIQDEDDDSRVTLYLRPEYDL